MRKRNRVAVSATLLTLAMSAAATAAPLSVRRLPAWRPPQPSSYRHCRINFRHLNACDAFHASQLFMLTAYGTGAWIGGCWDRPHAGCWAKATGVYLNGERFPSKVAGIIRVTLTHGVLCGSWLVFRGSWPCLTRPPGNTR